MIAITELLPLVLFLVPPLVLKEERETLSLLARRGPFFELRDAFQEAPAWTARALLCTNVEALKSAFLNQFLANSAHFHGDGGPVILDAATLLLSRTGGLLVQKYFCKIAPLRGSLGHRGEAALNQALVKPPINRFQAIGDPVVFSLIRCSCKDPFVPVRRYPRYSYGYE